MARTGNIEVKIAGKFEPPLSRYQCDKTGGFVTPQYGWKYCPFCGAELKPRKYLVPEYHEIFP